jgi:competence ComEA-like helix-hairpin-helix protein
MVVADKVDGMRFLVLSLVLGLTLTCCARSVERAKTEPIASPANRTVTDQPCVNLNRATADELKSLPGVGEVIAKRIIDYRERNGRFRRPEEIIIIQGFSEKKYRAIADLVCVD